MQTEIEVKFLHVNHDVLRAKLRAAGAKLTHSMRVMKRVTLDFPKERNQADGRMRGWIRIRDEGDKITLTYKQLDSWDLHGVREIETTVTDFAAAQQIFEAAGMRVGQYAETKRETWRLVLSDASGVPDASREPDVSKTAEGQGTPKMVAEVVLDEWPWIDPFCEIEAADEATVRAVAAKLGFNWQEDAVFGTAIPAYQAQYDITEQEFHTLSEFVFDQSLPELLQSRKRSSAVHPQRGAAGASTPEASGRRRASGEDAQVVARRVVKEARA